MVPAETELYARLEGLPGLAALLPLLDGLAAPAYLVGGAVRDLLRGARSVDLDLAVEGDAAAVAHELARRLGGSARHHERFGTATVCAGSLVADLAATRREVYERPGALPTVEPASIAEDLARRDFTVNAMAVGLSGDDAGRLLDPHGGRADLDCGLVRVLHARSFVDDPTRLLRALRYEARLGFALEPETERLARAAVTGGALATVSGQRVRVELWGLLGEPAAAAAVARVGELGLDRALHPGLEADAELVAAARRGAAEVGASPEGAALAALCVRAGAGVRADLERWVGTLGLAASDRDALLRAAAQGPALAEELGSPLRDSALYELLGGEPAEVLALAIGLGAPADPVRRFVGKLRSTRLEITGDDLVAAGVPESPALGRALRETLRMKLDGELVGREQELRAALALAREAA